jgi:hypothetical protein
MPVFLINAKPRFDISSIGRKEGLDLFKDERLQLIQALGNAGNQQIERLWGNWPACLEGNRNNLRAEVERIVAAALARPDEHHVLLFILNQFAPNDPTQHVTREFLEDIRRMVRVQDRNNVSLDTATPAPNVWSIVFLRPRAHA